MARPVYTDYLQSFAFWMMDIAPISFSAQPVFNPVLGFSSISAPEISVEQYSFRPANWYFDRHVVQRAAISPFTARRGVTFYDSDFWRWTQAALSGNTSTNFSIGGASYRRSFVLIHFFARNPLLALAGNVAEANGTTPTGVALNFGPFEFALRVPAKAYLLKNCIPLRWRSGNDFDAADGSVSIAELDFNCEMVEEISLGGAVSTAINTTLGAAGSLVSTVVGGITSALNNPNP